MKKKIQQPIGYQPPPQAQREHRFGTLFAASHRRAVVSPSVGSRTATACGHKRGVGEQSRFYTNLAFVSHKTREPHRN